MAGTALIDDMRVANVGFLIENLGKDAGELQYLRELVQNAFEAIQRAERSDGLVVIDYEEIEGVRKLRITDNGIGMTPDEVNDNINRLSASAGVQAFDKNFGIGAKITAAVQNPHGVMYKTWKCGEGSLTILGRQDGRYGRIPIPNEDGSLDYWIPLRQSERHPIIEDGGVSVVLLGTSQDDDTWTAPHPGVDLKSQWIAAFLERRYFQIPENVTLKIPRTIFDSELGSEREQEDAIRGQHYYLEKHSTDRGRAELPEVDAIVRWWILTEKITEGGKTWNNRGHVAALYQNELYEVRSGAAKASALKDFGVYAGHGRVVIYVEPTNVLGANTSRSALILKGGRPVDYATIGAAFAENIPIELATYMAGQVSSEQGDHKKSILRNLREVETALDQARYRRSPKGSLRRTHDDDGGGAISTGEARDEGEGAGSTPSRPPDATGRVGREYLRKSRDENERQSRVQKVNADPLPRIVWDEEGKTVRLGRAAMYTRPTHVITANAKFPFYRDFLEWSVEEAKNRVAGDIDEQTLRQICEDEVRRWFEEALAQAVVFLRPLSYDENWGPKVFESGLSDDGLTAAVVSHAWLMMSAIKRGLSGRLGRMKETVA